MSSVKRLDPAEEMQLAVGYIDYYALARGLVFLLGIPLGFLIFAHLGKQAASQATSSRCHLGYPSLPSLGGCCRFWMLCRSNDTAPRARTLNGPVDRRPVTYSRYSYSAHSAMLRGGIGGSCC